MRAIALRLPLPAWPAARQAAATLAPRADRRHYFLTPALRDGPRTAPVAPGSADTTEAAPEVRAARSSRFQGVVREPRPLERPGVDPTALSAVFPCAEAFADPDLALNQELHREARREGTYWSRHYANNDIFRARINAYVQGRRALMEKVQAGTMAPPEIRQGIKRLAKLLAIAYGFAGTEGWAAGTLGAYRRAGAAYARPSIGTNWMTQAPGIARAALCLGIELLKVLAPKSAAALAVAKSAVNMAYVPVQLALIAYGPVLAAGGQSAAFAASQAQATDRFGPSVKSSERVGEDGEGRSLRAPDAVARDIEALAVLHAQGKWDAGSAARMNDLHLEAAVSELYVQLNVQTHQGTNRALRALINFLAAAASELAIWRTEAARVARSVADPLAPPPVTGPVQPVAQPQPAAPSPSEPPATADPAAVEPATVQTSAAEPASTALPAEPAATTVQATEAFDWSPFLPDLANLGLMALQPVLYALRHPGAATRDQLNKLETQLEILVASGAGNLLRNGELVPGRLDLLMKGAMQTRLEYLKAILEFDAEVYTAAMVSWLLAGAGQDAGARPRAIEIHFPSGGNAVSARQVAATAQGLRGAFAKMPTAAAREAFLRQAAQALGVPQLNLMKLMAIAGLYEDNLVSIGWVGKGEVEWLLGPDSKLPPQSIAMLRGALQVGRDSANAPPQARGHDAHLARLKGDVEKLSTTGSVHQAAQKLGQTLTWGVLGSAGPGVIKAISTAITEALLFAAGDDPDAVGALNALIKEGAGAVTGAGSLLSIAVGYSYHRNIALKNQHRQRDDKARLPSTPHSGLLRQGQGEFFSVPNLDRLRGRVTSFQTLAATRIAPENLQDIPPLEVRLETRFWGDVLQQITVLSGQDLLRGFRTRHGGLDMANEAEIRRALHLEILEMLAHKNGERIAALPPDAPGGLPATPAQPL